MVMKRIASLSKIVASPITEGRLSLKDEGNIGSGSFKRHLDAKTEALSSLQSQVVEKDEKIASLEEELRIMRSQRQQETIMAGIEARLLRQEKNAAEARLRKMTADLDNRIPMEEYASLIKQTAPLTENSTYVTKLQAQLCKALHNQTVLDNQLAMATATYEQMVGDIKEEGEDILQIKISSDTEFTRKLQAAEREKAELVEDYEEKLRTRDSIIHNLVESSRSKSCPTEKRQDDPEARRSASEKVADMSRVFDRQLDLERTEKHLRQSLESKVHLVQDLEGTIKSQQDTIGKLNDELEQQKQKARKREAKRVHLRHASFATVTTSASRIPRTMSFDTLSSSKPAKIDRNPSW